jgi:hypothetical protein
MKVLTLLILTIASANAQAVLRVNNTSGSAAPYTSLAAAITAAGVNDIILLEGTTISYGDHTIAKKVTIIGPGYFLSENTGLQTTLSEAILGSLTLNAGASGSRIIGLGFSSGANINISNVSNIEISNNRFDTSFGGQIGFNPGTGANFLVKGNYMSSLYSNGSYSGIIVSNNYIARQVVLNPGLVDLTFSNNISNNNNFSTFLNSIVYNNIFIGNPVVFNSTTYTNNVFEQGAIAGADPTNIFNVAISSLFLGLTGNTTDTQWRLMVGSPAIGAGIGGIDCGMYGGATPYRPSGIQVGQHTIYSLSVPATVIQNAILNVTVSAKTN